MAIVHAATPAGTIIKNQASASYKDSNGVVRFTTSNIVETLIQQVVALQLTQDQTRLVAAGNQIFLPHTITNTGNGADSFDVAAVNNSGDDFDLSGLAVYADENQDGQPDIYTQVFVTPSLAMQQSWSFVVAGSVAPGTPAGYSSELLVTARSQFESGVSQSNTDSISVSDDAVIELTKSISTTKGLSPGGPYTVTLSYRNAGSAEATDVTLIDALPSGMSYLAGTGRWNKTGNEVLTDGNAADVHGTFPTLRYCAYQASCPGLPEADQDADTDSSNQITAIISSLASGETGQITFQVEIDNGLNASNLFNTGEFEYTDSAGLSPRQFSNTVAFKVLHSTDVVLNGSSLDSGDGANEPNIVASIAQGGFVNFDNFVWNIGNGTDTYDITVDKLASGFPTGSVFRLLQSDGVTPLLDSNNNGLPDTGPLAVGLSYKVVLQVIPPASAVGDNGGAGFEVSTTATSISDATIANAMLNRLDNISTANIDITNLAEVGEAAALGVGAGPESSAVSTFSVAPGSDVIVGLYINNTGLTPVSPDLAVTTSEDYSSVELPAGWTVSFRFDGEDDRITNTGVINPGEFLLINATVSVPVNATDGDTSLYFRALSDVTGAVDIKHDVISVETVELILLELDQAGQTGAGGSYVYSHLLSNIGNVVIPDLQITTDNSQNAQGWTSVVYEDTDGDDALGAADQVVDTISNLGIGDQRRLFVRIFAPAGAATLSVNQTTITASWNAGADEVSITDTTTVAEIEITIIKEQAPDFGCDGALDGSYGVGGFAVEPGNNCVSYRLTATNAGQATAFNVDVADATPEFTEYFGAAVCSDANCSVVEPEPGGQGNVVASLPSLAAGAAMVVEFSVRVE